MSGYFDFVYDLYEEEQLATYFVRLHHRILDMYTLNTKAWNDDFFHYNDLVYRTFVPAIVRRKMVLKAIDAKTYDLSDLPKTPLYELRTEYARVKTRADAETKLARNGSFCPICGHVCPWCTCLPKIE